MGKCLGPVIEELTIANNDLVSVYLRTLRVSSCCSIIARRANVPSYKKPPVGEALIDIRVDPFSKDKLETLEQLQRAIGSDYPNKRVRYKIQGSFEVHAQQVVATPSAPGVYGYQFESEDRRKIIQARLDGFTHNRIKLDPDEAWPGWKIMRDEAKRGWDAYVQALNPCDITRLAVRYINHIVIPKVSIELYDYFTAAPMVPPALPYRDMAHFYSRVAIPIPEYNATAILSHAPAQKRHIGAVTVTLDIDIVRSERIPLNTFLLWETLDQLRDIKNTIFEASLLPAAKELFQ